MYVCVDYLENGIKKLLENRSDIFEFHENEIKALLNRYCDEIELFNPAYGLVSVKDRSELVIKHILDSLAPLEFIKKLVDNFPQNPCIADVGSGAGMPGIPLAVALPNVSFCLIERMGRRAGFLQNTAAVLALHNVEILEMEMEKAPPALADMVCFRAFRPLSPEILKKLFRLLKSGGYIAAYKGRRAALDTEMAALSTNQNGQNIDAHIISYKVPFLDDERNILFAKKP
ncbi:MAG: 16S rRNA (guanine(527)-N(7))-methyltransferase RsmG [Treponema sp.]|nr:16S rRNA (guanine(527)-N(7))-methyltransferase RsmG [Treponema sp.]